MPAKARYWSTMTVPSKTCRFRIEPLIPIPPGGLQLKFWYRTALPGHRCLVSLNHYDASQEIGSPAKTETSSWRGPAFGKRRTTVWQSFRPRPNSYRLNLLATEWTDAGENRVGLVR